MKKAIEIMIKKIMYGFTVLAGIFCLSGCDVHTVHQPKITPVTINQQRALYRQALREYNVQIISLGETLRFVILSDDLFQPDSANLRDRDRPALALLAKLMKTYDKDTVTVAAYTDDADDVSRQQALTTRQAQVVASFLWAQGIDARLTAAVGYNRQNPVDWNENPVGRHNNRRVEVSFRFYPPYVPYS